MEKSYSESYAAAGVDITAGYRSVELMKQYVARTMNEHCIGGLGGFGGLFELDCTGYKHPVLISGTDGVGTKLKVAQLIGKHATNLVALGAKVARDGNDHRTLLVLQIAHRDSFLCVTKRQSLCHIALPASRPNHHNIR